MIDTIFLNQADKPSFLIRQDKYAKLINTSKLLIRR